jgi:hypothetical protein
VIENSQTEAQLMAGNHRLAFFFLGFPMTPKKTLQEREKELRALLATTAGQQELQELASRYCTASGELNRPAVPPSPTSWSTRGAKGLISG